MCHTLSYYPPLDYELAAAIDSLRCRHDPTRGFARAHVTVMFPVPESVGESRLAGHSDSVLKDWNPFDIRFGGFHS
jgi:hypothetical protein